MNRILLASLLAAAVLPSSLHAQAKREARAERPSQFSVVEASISEMRAALEQGRVTSRELVTQYLARIATYEDKLHAAIAVNPNALQEADALDRERAAGQVRGPLHGIPIALKDNIHTTNMPTTGGALAFVDYVPPYEATLTKNLRDAGAIIIAKTGMTELANWVAGAPTPMPGNYNAVGGFGFNPYDPRRDPREATDDGRPALQTGGSSSGVGHHGEFLGGQRRHRNLRVDPQPVESEHAGGHQADGRPHQPLRRDSDHRRSGHARSDGENGDRRRDHARRAGRSRARSERSRDVQVHAAAGPRLHAVPQGRRPEGRAHRHPARVLLRSCHAARRQGHAAA